MSTVEKGTNAYGSESRVSVDGRCMAARISLHLIVKEIPFSINPEPDNVYSFIVKEKFGTDLRTAVDTLIKHKGIENEYHRSIATS
jgi:hypothetical protein